MIDVLTVQEIEMNVATLAAAREEKFQSAYHAPLIRARLVQDVLENPQAAEILKQADPDEYARVMQNIKRMQSILKAKA